jgi:hypothetical protein
MAMQLLRKRSESRGETSFRKSAQSSRSLVNRLAPLTVPPSAGEDEVVINGIDDGEEILLPDNRFKIPAEHPDLRIGRVQVFSVLAIDLAELVARPIEDRRILQRLRAEDTLFPRLRDALIGAIPGCSDEAEKIRTRMTESQELGGKAVWTDQFLERYAPVRLPTPTNLTQNDVPVPLSERLSDDPNSPLHFLRFKDHVLKMFRDGTICYTVQTLFEDHVSRRHGGGLRPPATVDQAIARLTALSELLAENFRIALADLIRSHPFREAIANGVQSQGERLALREESTLHAADLRRQSKQHTAIFVENFFEGDIAAELLSVTDAAADAAHVELRNVVASSSLAGLLNSATWYESYDRRYIQSLRRKEIGYRDDEIYLSDGDATVISARGFWREGTVKSGTADPLSRYKLDIVLAIQYNVACMAYCGSTLAYYQSHPDVSNLENDRPLDALTYVIEGRAILSHLDQTLDLALLVDQGFMRVFIRRLREELGVEAAVTFIRQRVEDGSTSVGLKSAVLSAENTSKGSLKAAIENNQIQRTIRGWAIIAIVIAILLFAIGQYLAASGSTRHIVCTSNRRTGQVVCTAR